MEDDCKQFDRMLRETRLFDPMTNDQLKHEILLIAPDLTEDQLDSMVQMIGNWRVVWA